MLYFPTSIQYHDEHKDKTVLAWHSKMKGRGLEHNSRTTLSVSMLLSLYACKSASPEDLSARIVERKYVLTLRIQLNDFQSCCRHWRRQNYCENEVSPKNVLSLWVNWLTIRYAPGNSTVVTEEEAMGS